MAITIDRLAAIQEFELSASSPGVPKQSSGPSATLTPTS